MMDDNGDLDVEDRMEDRMGENKMMGREADNEV